MSKRLLELVLGRAASYSLSSAKSLPRQVSSLNALWRREYTSVPDPVLDDASEPVLEYESCDESAPAEEYLGSTWQEAESNQADHSRKISITRKLGRDLLFVRTRSRIHVV
jgi:hypothetical protein